MRFEINAAIDAPTIPNTGIRMRLAAITINPNANVK